MDGLSPLMSRTYCQAKPILLLLKVFLSLVMIMWFSTFWEKVNSGLLFDQVEKWLQKRKEDMLFSTFVSNNLFFCCSAVATKLSSCCCFAKSSYISKFNSSICVIHCLLFFYVTIRLSGYPQCTVLMVFTLHSACHFHSV